MEILAGMLEVDDVADRVRSIGFGCRRCGACCRRVAEDSNLVIVSPAEVRAIHGGDRTGLG